MKTKDPSDDLLGSDGRSRHTATSHFLPRSSGRLNVNPLIYWLSALQTAFGGTHAPANLQFFHRGITGNNNGYAAKPGEAYGEVLSNGTLIVESFLGVPFAPPSGAPSTPSNP